MREEVEVALQENIPVVDFRDWTDPTMRARFVRDLGNGLEKLGFVAVTGHGISQWTLEHAYATARKLFALPKDIKAQYETPENGRQRGYTSFGVEHAKDHDAPDLKEFWHIGRHLGAAHPLHQSGDIPPNLFPNELPEFGEVFSDYFSRVESFCLCLLDALDQYLGQPQGWFREVTSDGNSIVRIIHYPPMPDDAPAGSVRAAQHEDINLMTVLPVSTAPGLQLMTNDGEWMAVQTPPDVLVVDTGDMMKLITGGVLPATTHRVVNPADAKRGESRLSMPFFMHPHPDWVLKTIGSDEPGVLTRDFLGERLKAIGVA
ncbi:MAG: isopenicillin N synthase family oxygenase [Deltaproteobacteria bacterium]|nr:isopenicillin N synthase family oxygenase [Deltaproteobacteria bacterium]